MTDSPDDEAVDRAGAADRPPATDGGDRGSENGHVEDAASEGPGDGGNGGDDGVPEQFREELANARTYLDADAEDLTALVVGVVREGEAVDTTFAQRADDPRQEGYQALALLAAHVRLVADEAGVDYETVAGDAAALAAQVEAAADLAPGDDPTD